MCVEVCERRTALFTRREPSLFFHRLSRHGWSLGKSSSREFAFIVTKYERTPLRWGIVTVERKSDAFIWSNTNSIVSRNGNKIRKAELHLLQATPAPITDVISHYPTLYHHFLSTTFTIVTTVTVTWAWRSSLNPVNFSWPSASFQPSSSSLEPLSALWPGKNRFHIFLF